LIASHHILKGFASRTWIRLSENGDQAARLDSGSVLCHLQHRQRYQARIFICQKLFLIQEFLRVRLQLTAEKQKILVNVNMRYKICCLLTCILEQKWLKLQPAKARRSAVWQLLILIGNKNKEKRSN
jgi:hypothetical protein